MFFFRIAFLASGNDVPLGTLPPADDRHDVVHGQRAGSHLIATIIALTRGTAPLPPLAGTQLLRLLPLAPDFLFADRDDERRRLHD